jgi:tetratricopeptide (TPR) repeat protein
MVRIGCRRYRGGAAENQADVKVSDELSTHPKIKSRYVDSFAVSSQPEHAQPQTKLEDENANKNKSAGGTFSYVASPLVDIGVEHHSRGEYEKALKCFAAALNEQRLNLGGEHICVAHTLGNMGAAYLKQGRLFLASEVLDESLRMKLRLRGKQNKEEQEQCTIHVADLLNNLGNVAYLQNNHLKSLKYYWATLKDLRTYNGPEEELAKTLHNIGRLYVHKKEWKAALTVLTECRRMECDLHGSDNIVICDTLNLIGFVYVQSSSADLGLQSFLRALSISQAVYGTDHPDIAASLLNIGMALEAKGQLMDAWESYNGARKIYERVGVDQSHPGLKATRRSIALMEQSLGERRDGDRGRSNCVSSVEQRDEGEI